MKQIHGLWPLIILLLVLLAQTALAQPDTPGFGLDGYEDNGSIGSGLAILIALGSGYGLLKMKQRKPQKR